MKKIIALILALTMALSMTACTVGGASTPATTPDSTGTDTPAATTGSLKGSNVRVVIGSTSTSGDSYMIAEVVTRYLAAEMGFNGKVDAVGNSTALDEVLNAKGDGKTVMMFHDMTFMSVLFGSVDAKYDIDNLTVGPRIGQNPGGCFGAAAESPYASLSEVTQYLIDNPTETVSFNIESGGTSHLAFAAYYLWVDETYGADVSARMKAIVGGTTAEKLQRLWDRNADVIYGDTSAFGQYTEDGVQDQLKMTMFDSCGKVNGVEINSMAETGITFGGNPFDFAKDFCMYFPKDIDAGVLAEYEAAMQKVCANPDFQAEMSKLFYNYLTPEETAVSASDSFIKAKRDMCAEIIELSPDLDSLT